MPARSHETASPTILKTSSKFVDSRELIIWATLATASSVTNRWAISSSAFFWSVMSLPMEREPVLIPLSSSNVRKFQDSVFVQSFLQVITVSKFSTFSPAGGVVRVSTTLSLYSGSGYSNSHTPAVPTTSSRE